LGSSVIDYALASDGIICSVIDFKVGVEIISSHMSLLVELENIMEEEAKTKSDARSQTQTHRTTRYIWKENVKQDFIDCLNDNVSSLYVYGVQYCLQNSNVEEAVNILYCMIGRTGRKMEHRGKVYKELDHRYDEECQGKKKETKVARKEYKYRGKYWKCRAEYEKLLETKR
jgi:hypothetical protein